jgi:hypothetical protein
VLALATFVLSTPPSLVLLDEPHSFLHPTAERSLLEFLNAHPEHLYVISTHSSVLINSVDPSRVTHLSPPGEGYSSTREVLDSSRVLFDLGYRNSDFLFYDRLVFVEGESDSEIFPILLEATGMISNAEQRTGFPSLDGVGNIQLSILRMEKYLSAVGRTRQPRAYILDGDQKEDDAVLARTRNPITGGVIPVKFLPAPEIENYLLVPEAISLAINEEAVVAGDSQMATPRDVATVLSSAVARKASDILGEVYENYGRL